VKPINNDIAPYRVRYKGSGILGWAYPDTLREVHGIIIRDKPLRMEIFVRWITKYPAGYINVKELVRLR